MNIVLLERPLFYVAGHYVSFLGLMAFAGLFAVGLLLARFLQSEIVRRFFARFKLDTNFIAIVTTILSVAALAFFTVSAINAAGIPLLWTAPVPGLRLSLLNIFFLIALLVTVFWFSSRTKRFLFNRFLVKSGLDRALQYAIAQIVSNLAGSLIFTFLRTRHQSRRADRFRGRGRHRHWLWVAEHRQQFHQRPGHPGGASYCPRRSHRSRGDHRPGPADPRPKHGHCHQRQHRHDCAELEIHRFAGDELDLRRSAGAFSYPGGVGYGSDAAKSRSLIAAARSDLHVLKPPPNVFLKQFGESSIDFELIVWSTEMSNRPSRFKSDLNFAIEKKLREAGIEIPFPQREVRIRAESLPTVEEGRAGVAASDAK